MPTPGAISASSPPPVVHRSTHRSVTYRTGCPILPMNLRKRPLRRMRSLPSSMAISQNVGGEGASEGQPAGVLADDDEAASAGEMIAEAADIDIALGITDRAPPRLSLPLAESARFWLLCEVGEHGPHIKARAIAATFARDFDVSEVAGAVAPCMGRWEGPGEKTNASTRRIVDLLHAMVPGASIAEVPGAGTCRRSAIRHS
jgi:hypothetical protein